MFALIAEPGMFSLTMGVPNTILSGVGLLIRLPGGYLTILSQEIIIIGEAAKGIWLFPVIPTNQWVCAQTGLFLLGKSKLGGQDVLG